MTLQTVTDSGGAEQPLGTGDIETPLSCALRDIGSLLSESPLARQQFQDARHDQARADRLAEEAAQAGQNGAAATAQLIAERHKADPHRRLSRPIGNWLAGCLAVLDAMPAYWSAEAFGLDQGSTFALTALLCAALGGAMWLLDLFTAQGRRLALRVLGGTLVAGFAGLFFLRFNYLQIVSGDTPWSAAAQALALTGLSAALVAVGFVVLAHRSPRALASAEKHSRRTMSRGTKEAAEAACATAAMSRAALEDTVVIWALTRKSTAISHDQLIPAIHEAIAILFSK